MKTAKLKEWTYEDYLALPEGDPFRYEVINGDLYMTPAPNLRHQRISMNISRIVSSFLHQNPLGEIFSAPCDVIFVPEPLQYVEPDLVFVSKERSAILTEKNIQGVPDLLVEILSQTTKIRDRRLKLSLYERFGVPEYWIVDPETESVQVFQLVDGRYPASLEFCKTDILESPHLPGLAISLSDVFSS
ncbi:MAG: hypothetical protein D084_Lepto4C00168G0001 [Leptospirillum sp. Group IV 'UBA BS']|nr:MAG: hypothetical protein D084_Lepto4C00168G0001 [Leptospirillum sp. Group IV 'UBA BS']MCL5284609.1 Uma2 family endonuclease [Nitrospirota bacterium]